MSQNRRRGSSGLESYDDYIEAMRDTLRQANRVAEPLSFNLGIDEDMQRFFSMAQLADGSSRWADRSPALRTRWDVQPTEEKKPIITLVSSLPKTTYKESDDSKDRTLSYVKAQRKVLKLLDKQAADELTPVMAATCTQSIDPVDKRPAWEEALRLCYYMRSQGFDTYAKFSGRQHKIMRLFVAECFSTQNRKKDLLYWKQNIETDVVQYIAPRNRQGFDYEPTEHLPPPPLPSEFLNLGREVDGAHEGNEEAAELEARIIEAHERLDHLLLREQQHPLEIEDILDDIAALRRRLHEL